MFKRSLVFSLFIIAVSGWVSCKKIDTTDAGSDLIPAVDNVSTFDTVLDVITDNMLLNDSLHIFREEEHMLGIIENDPDFGKTTGEIYASLTPASYFPHPFAKRDSTLVIDSVVMALSFSRLYGDSNSVQKINVYELSASGSFGPSFIGYRTDTTGIEVAPVVLGSKMVDFRTLNDSLLDIRKRDTLRVANQLRIQLDKSLASRFLTYDTTNAYKNDSAFRTFFRGVAIKADAAASPAKNAVAYFKLSDANTRLIFYYRVLDGTRVTDTLATEYGFYSSNYANANSIIRTPGNGYQAYLSNSNPSDDKIYLQSSPGSMASVRIPGLSTLSDRVVHRAELIFEVVDNVPEPVYPRPEQLFLDANDTANKRILCIPYDFSYENNFLSLVGGAEANNKFVFNISRYVQNVITKKYTNLPLRLSAPMRTNAGELRGTGVVIPAPPGSYSGYPINKTPGYGRVVLAGGNYANPLRRARLRIIYSKI
jgi:hypothetical protein